MSKDAKSGIFGIIILSVYFIVVLFCLKYFGEEDVHWATLLTLSFGLIVYDLLVAISFYFVDRIAQKKIWLFKPKIGNIQ